MILLDVERPKTFFSQLIINNIRVFTLKLI